jgi:hypothetical protein
MLMKVSSSCTTSGVRRVINSDIPSYFEINFYYDLYIFCANMFKEQGFHEQRTFSIIPYFNMELCRNIMVELNSLFHSRGGVDFNDE